MRGGVELLRAGGHYFILNPPRPYSNRPPTEADHRSCIDQLGRVGQIEGRGGQMLVEVLASRDSHSDG